jgi:hypothetical protein
MVSRIVKRSVKVFVASLSKNKVDFVIAGTQKGGTSALDAYLRTHPEICMAARKEIHFFDNEYIFRFSPIKYPIYHSYFNPRPHHRIIGESTPIYMYWLDAPRRIWHYNPRMKIVIVLRNPIERAYSHWNKNKNADRLTFWDALQKERDRCKEAFPYQHRVFSYVDRGFYSEQLRRIWQYFPKEQVLLLRNEDLRNSPNDTLQRLADFLGIGCFQFVEAKNVHSSRYISTITAREKDYLKNVYQYEIKALERMLGWDCREWLS